MIGFWKQRGADINKSLGNKCGFKYEEEQ
jgi:hypothetical protein